ncbi:hypothetical protein [Streptomyces fradiae]|uniref:hypothetical protein n=1 Tax=Streptomyces fradiae TaxID=1906 RepID=UPI0029436231|nr:hypothetical protein [Streptomyces fradiae]WOI59664.1 hypothetical protein RYQ63_06950 [Streptomyces fradiae]
MDAVRVALLRDVLAGTAWPSAARSFAGALRSSVVRHGGGLLLVGTAGYEPWHLAAHLGDEARWAGLPELSPTLVRHRVRPGDPPHLAVGPGRLEVAGRGATLLVVAPDRPDGGLLERVHGARRAGATVLALGGGDDGDGDVDREVRGVAHEALTVDPARDGGVDLDTVQHLVSAAAGEAGPPSRGGGRGRFGDRLSRLADHLTSPPPPERW